MTDAAYRSPLRTALFSLAIAACVVGAITGRAVWGGEQAIVRGTVALQAGDPRLAIEASREAATWYVPAAPHVRVAYARLAAIASEAERLRDRETSLFAWRAIITASESTRWLVTPHADDARQAREAVARIESTAPRPIDHVSEPPQAVEKAFLTDLSRRVGPRPTASLALGLCFVAMLLGAVIALYRGFDETGRMHRGRILVPALLTLGGCIGYIALLVIA